MNERISCQNAIDKLIEFLIKIDEIQFITIFNTVMPEKIELHEEPNYFKAMSHNQKEYWEVNK